MKVAVCDDQKEQNQVIQSYFHKYGQEGFQITYYTDGESLLADFKRDPFDLVVMDIQLPGRDGTQLVKEMKEFNDGLYVLFISSYTSYVTAAFDLEAFNYLVKPVSYPKFERCLDKIQEKYKKCHQKFLAEFDGAYSAFQYKDIRYFNCYDRKTSMDVCGKERRVRGSLNSIEKQLPKDQFMRIHQGYIVNLRYVDCIEDRFAVLADGTKLPISVRKNSRAIDAFLKYKMRCMG